MSIDSVCNAISKAIDKARVPAMNIPSILLLCTAVSRPGLSSMVTTAKIIRRLAAEGIPVGAAADGTPNMWQPAIFATVDEIFHAIKFDAKIQVTNPIGGVQSLGIGSNGGGPMVVHSFNIVPTEGGTGVTV